MIPQHKHVMWLQCLKITCYCYLQETGSLDLLWAESWAKSVTLVGSGYLLRKIARFENKIQLSKFEDLVGFIMQFMNSNCKKLKIFIERRVWQELLPKEKKGLFLNQNIFIFWGEDNRKGSYHSGYPFFLWVGAEGAWMKWAYLTYYFTGVWPENSRLVG